MSNEHSLFFQQTEAGEVPVAFAPTVRTRVTAPCPGRIDNIVTLSIGEDARGGISRPRNVGSCPLHLACFDQTGTFIGAIKLEPGEAVEWFQVPGNTHTIKFGCHKNCTGAAVLEYETANIA
jgi:hypothetical protein